MDAHHVQRQYIGGWLVFYRHGYDIVQVYFGRFCIWLPFTHFDAFHESIFHAGLVLWNSFQAAVFSQNRRIWVQNRVSCCPFRRIVQILVNCYVINRDVVVRLKVAPANASFDTVLPVDAPRLRIDHRIVHTLSVQLRPLLNSLHQRIRKIRKACGAKIFILNEQKQVNVLLFGWNVLEFDVQFGNGE